MLPTHGMFHKDIFFYYDLFSKSDFTTNRLMDLHYVFQNFLMMFFRLFSCLLKDSFVFCFLFLFVVYTELSKPCFVGF